MTEIGTPPPPVDMGVPSPQTQVLEGPPAPPEAVLTPDQIQVRERQEQHIEAIADIIIQSKVNEIKKLDTTRNPRTLTSPREAKLREPGAQELVTFDNLASIKSGDFSVPDDKGDYAIDLSRNSIINETSGNQLTQILKIDGDVFTCNIEKPDGTIEEVVLDRGVVLSSFLTATKDRILSQMTDKAEQDLMSAYIDIAENGIMDAPSLEDPSKINQTIKEAGQSLGMLTPEDELAIFDTQIAKLIPQMRVPGVSQIIDELRVQREKRRQEFSEQGEVFLSPKAISERSVETIADAINETNKDIELLRRRKAQGEKIDEKEIETAQLRLKELKDQQKSVSEGGEITAGIQRLQAGDLPIEEGRRARLAFRAGDASGFADAVSPNLKIDSKKSFDREQKRERFNDTFKKGKRTALFATLGSAAMLLFLLKSGMEEH